VKLWITSVKNGFIAIFQSKEGSYSTKIVERKPTIRLVECIINSSIWKGVENILNAFKVSLLAYISVRFQVG
jgi:hypothetical protein